jgi:hypothetical protein
LLGIALSLFNEPSKVSSVTCIIFTTFQIKDHLPWLPCYYPQYPSPTQCHLFFLQETPSQNAELPSWLGRLLEPVSRLRLLATGQGTRSPRTQQLLAISLIIGLQLVVIVVWNLVSSAHLDLVNIYPSQRSIQVSTVFYYFLSLTFNILSSISCFT